ncbi:MAG: hypothetical protein V3V08_24815 [Nannocystaceae bacterium]
MMPNRSRSTYMYRQRGATMVSVMLLTVSLLTVAMLVIRASTREVTEAGALVARERAMMVAQGAIDLATARYRAELRVDRDAMNAHLAGSPDNKQTDLNLCTQAHLDCIPGDGDVPRTGQRNTALTGNSACGGRPCMRPGAIVELPDSSGGDVLWADMPMASLMASGDSEARVTVWVRNNTSDALGGTDTEPGSWIVDRDRRVVLTAMATIRGTMVAIEQEMILGPGDSQPIWQMPTPDEGYGVGHNNDNTAIEVCVENFLTADVAG